MIYSIIAERYLDNKKLVVVGNPNFQVVTILFYRDDILLTDDSDFTWNQDVKTKFEEDLSELHEEYISKNGVEYIAGLLEKYLKYIKDPVIDHITIKGSVK